jgi:hypothetical protein
MPSGGHLDPGKGASLSQVGWSVTHAPAAGVQATATRAAGTAGVRHVCTGVSIVVSGGPVAPAAQTLTFNLRDGASGAGTILASWTVGVEAVAGKTVPIPIPPLAIPGTAATAMTLEGSAAPGANTLESVVLTGYDVGS